VPFGVPRTFAVRSHRGKPSSASGPVGRALFDYYQLIIRGHPMPPVKFPFREWCFYVREWTDVNITLSSMKAFATPENREISLAWLKAHITSAQDEFNAGMFRRRSWHQDHAERVEICYRHIGFAYRRTVSILLLADLFELAASRGDICTHIKNFLIDKYHTEYFNSFEAAMRSGIINVLMEALTLAYIKDHATRAAPSPLLAKINWMASEKGGTLGSAFLEGFGPVCNYCLSHFSAEAFISALDAELRAAESMNAFFQGFFMDVTGGYKEEFFEKVRAVQATLAPVAMAPHACDDTFTLEEKTCVQDMMLTILGPETPRKGDIMPKLSKLFRPLTLEEQDAWDLRSDFSDPLEAFLADLDDSNDP
jgi:hypothetical protein